MEGYKELLGIWISEHEGASFWAQVLTELNNRGVKGVFVFCVNGLTGFPDAIKGVFPKSDIQLCIVHLVRNSLKYVSWKYHEVDNADKQLVESVKPLLCEIRGTFPESGLRKISYTIYLTDPFLRLHYKKPELIPESRLKLLNLLLLSSIIVLNSHRWRKSPDTSD